MIKIIKDNVAILPIEHADKIGSLYVPEIARERLNQGFVKYRGPDTKWLKIGMYVIFSGYTGTLTQIEGEGKLIIMPERFVIAELPEPKNIIVPGLFLRDREGYFPATYETAMNYIALAYGEDHAWRDSVQVKNARTNPNDIEVMNSDSDAMPSV